MDNKTGKNSITISKKALAGIAPVIGISAVLIAKSNPAVILLLIGVGLGIYIGANLGGKEK